MNRYYLAIIVFVSLAMNIVCRTEIEDTFIGIDSSEIISSQNTIIPFRFGNKKYYALGIKNIDPPLDNSELDFRSLQGEIDILL